MSSRARVAKEDIHPFDWGQGAARPADPFSPEPPVRDDDLPAAPTAALLDEHRVAELEHDAFARGYEQGQRAGAEAAAAAAAQAATATVKGLFTKLTDTIEQLSSSRQDLIRRTERQLVELAMAIAKQVLRRELSIDRSLLVAMARVALDRLGDCQAATIRLNPADFAELNAGAQTMAGANVTIVADPGVAQGGCLVECDAGWMSAGLDSQFTELTRALLGQ